MFSFKIFDINAGITGVEVLTVADKKQLSCEKFN